ncbi:MAG: hypothetical protein M1830_004373 [Pleopsidium flavum]|nr:MAG: hypothetical protein M1830_004373 [Pleopsidium flavum]
MFPSKAKAKGKVAKAGETKKESDNGNLKDTSAEPSTLNASAVGQQQNAGAVRQPKAKAQIKIENGELKVKVDDEWVGAIYLDEIRARVLEETKAQGSYDHPPARGKHPLDVTAFHQGHKSWDESRDKRPRILFEFKKNGRKDPSNEVGIWIDNDRVVLGPDDLPIRNFPDIPKLCSSQMEGYRMEAISRLDSRICISDFRARMMKDTLPGSNSISMRKTRFRLRCRCLAWEQRAGSDFWENKLKAEMTEHMVRNNSTEQLEDLSMAEVENLQLENSGKNPERARGRALADGVRAQRLEAAKERNAKKLELQARELKKEFDEDEKTFVNEIPKGNNAPTTRKRKRGTGVREPDSDGLDEESQEEHAPNKWQSWKAKAFLTKKRKRAGVGAGEAADDLDNDSDKEPAPKKRHTLNSNAPTTKKRKRTTGMGALDSDEDEEVEPSAAMERVYQDTEDFFDAMAKARREKRRCNSSNRGELPPDSSAEEPETSHPLRQRSNQTASMAHANESSSSRSNELLDPALVEEAAVEDNDDESSLRGGTPASQSSDSSDTDTGEVKDSRDEFPRTQSEQDMVRDVIAMTRLDYERITGRVAPATNPGDNYISQWGVLQIHLNIFWTETNRVGDVPILAGLDEWTGGTMRWNGRGSTLQEMQGQYGQVLYDRAETELRAARAQPELLRGPHGGFGLYAEPSDDEPTAAFRQPADATATLPAFRAPNVAEAFSQIAAPEAELFGGINTVNQGQVEAFQQWLDVHGRACYEQRGGEQGDMSWDDYCLIWAIMDWESSSSRWSAPVYAENELPEPTLGANDSFFDDATRINDTAVEDALYIGPPFV